MRGRSAAIPVLAIMIAAMWIWRASLFTVSRPGEQPRPLALIDSRVRRPVVIDAVLPSIPEGLRRVRGGEGVLLVHYWGSWERHGAVQAAWLDSLSHQDSMRDVRILLVCFDPFPSVARWVGRHRLRMPVMLDLDGSLRKSLPCPSVPYTYVLDRRGRIAVAQPGEVDWFGVETGRTIERLLKEVAIITRPS